METKSASSDKDEIIGVIQLWWQWELHVKDCGSSEPGIRLTEGMSSFVAAQSNDSMCLQWFWADSEKVSLSS